MNTMQNRTQGTSRGQGAGAGAGRSQSGSSTFEEWTSAPTEFVQEYPASSILVAFGIGLGLGVIVGHSLSDAMTPSSSSRRNVERSMESFGRQVCEALRSSLPESVSRHLPI